MYLEEAEKIENEYENFLKEYNKTNQEQESLRYTKKRLTNEINKLVEKANGNKEALDIAGNAIRILQDVTDDAVKESYEFITDSVNQTLSRIFENNTRYIKLKDSMLGGQHPQLELELYAQNGQKRNLKIGTGRGILQVVSLLFILSLIVITKSRKILVMDEILSGLSSRTRQIVSEILWAFTSLGFQFIISEHGFIPEGAQVYDMAMDKDGISIIKRSYIAEKGIFKHDIKHDKTENEKDGLEDELEEMD